MRQGDRVTAGQVVARQERTDAEIALAEAEAARDQAAAELANLREGSRPEEIAVTEAALEAAAGAAARGAAPGRAADGAGPARRGDAGEPRHRDRRARHGADRGGAAAGAAGGRAAAGASAGGRRRRKPAEQAPRRRCATPAGGSTSGRSPRRSAARSRTSSAATGEIAGPTEPVVSILPDGAYKLVVFVGETGVAGIAPGSDARGALRRLPGRADRDGLLRRRRAGVHAAGDLLGREPPEARLPRRGAAAGGRAERSGRDRSSMSAPAELRSCRRRSSTCAT